MLTTQPPVLSHLCDKFDSIAEKEEKRSALALVLHGSLEGRDGLWQKPSTPVYSNKQHVRGIRFHNTCPSSTLATDSNRSHTLHYSHTELMQREEAWEKWQRLKSQL